MKYYHTVCNQNDLQTLEKFSEEKINNLRVSVAKTAVSVSSNHDSQKV